VKLLHAVYKWKKHLVHISLVSLRENILEHRTQKHVGGKPKFQNSKRKTQDISIGY